MVSSCKQTPNMDPPNSIAHWKEINQVQGGGGQGSMKELWPLEENKYIFY